MAEICKTLDERRAYIQQIFNLARINVVCSNQKEFAEKIGVNRSTLSLALKGDARYLTEGLEVRVRYFAQQYELDLSPAPASREHQAQPSGIYIPQETLDLYTNLSETCRNLSAIVARLGIQAPAQPGWTAPKNYQTD